MTDSSMPDLDSSIPPSRAVSLYGQEDAMENFPVLKAFQQYIDAEQAKARKRLLSMAVFFGIFTLAIIAIFVTMLLSANTRNQQLNDRLVEFVMKERERAAAVPAAPVVVQQPVAAHDQSAVLALSARIDDLNRKLEAEKADKAKLASRAVEKDDVVKVQPAKPSAADLEVLRLKELLKAERAKNEAEAKRRREEQLESYRREHYPELYAPRKTTVTPPVPDPFPVSKKTETVVSENLEQTDADDDANAGLDDASFKDMIKNAREAASIEQPKAKDTQKVRSKKSGDCAIRYFDDEESTHEPTRKSETNDVPQTAATESPSPAKLETVAPAPKPPAPRVKRTSLPVAVEGRTSSWAIP